MEELRINSQLIRQQDFKTAAENSLWYYNLLKRMLHEHIESKPLAQFMNGKSHRGRLSSHR